MISELDYFRELNLESVVIRLVLAMLFGGMIGIERGKKGRAAGFRTYMLVCIGATLSGILSQYIFVMLDTAWKDIARIHGRTTDISRIGSQVIGGVGFLGAGTIMFTSKNEIKGLTTAAGLWASACVGIAIGAGFYEAVALAFILISLIFKILPSIELAMIKNSQDMNLFLEIDSSKSLSDMIRALKSIGVKITELNITRKDQHLGIVCSIRLQAKIKRESVISGISAISGILLIEEV
ncbi:MAG: MgtC/SapB family protein [Bacillota bacterium]|nr:MgtC/SapB family protein [Bacillota bacterium]